jgi:hypothetical protein
MNRLIGLAVFAVLGIRAQTISLCPSPLHPDTVDRIVTVRGGGFGPTTSAAWWDADHQTPLPLSIQFVSPTTIRVTIPGTIGTAPQTKGTVTVTTGTVTLTATLTFTFLTTFLGTVCEVEPAEFTAQSNPVMFAVYGDLLYASTIQVSTVTPNPVPLVPQLGATVATASVQGAWPAGTLTGQVNSSSPIAANVATAYPFSLKINSVPTIAAAPASRLYAGQSASVNLTVSNGTPGSGFKWSLSPSTPSWITVQSAGASTATLVAQPPTNTDSTMATAQVVATDGVPSLAVSSSPVTAQFTVDAIPNLTLMVLPSGNTDQMYTIQPDQMYTVSFGTTRATPLSLSVQVNLGSQTAGFVLPGTTPGALPQVVSKVTFNIPPNCVLPGCNQAYTLQAGTAAGSFAMTGSVTATPPAGASAPPAIAFPTATLQQGSQVPHLDTNRVSVRTTSVGFDICVPGYSNTREVSSAAFRFVSPAGKTLSTPPAPLPVGQAFAGWFANNPQGGFTLVQSFNVKGDIKAIGQIFVTLTNSVGDSQELGPIDLASAPACTVM